MTERIWDSNPELKAAIDAEREKNKASVVNIASARKPKPEPVPISANGLAAYCDEDLALSFSRKHYDNLIYCAEKGKWFYWDTYVWREDKTLHIQNLARILCREQSIECQNMGDMPITTIKGIASAKTIRNVIDLAKSDARHSITLDRLDADPWLLNTPGGIIDLKTGDTIPNPQSRYCTKSTAVPAVPGPHPKWTRFLREATNGDDDYIRFIQQIFGYSLTGSISEHALFFVYGPGGNGKGVLINLIADILGDYASSAPLNTFTETRNEQHLTRIARLHGARFVYTTEVNEGQSWDEAKLKALTGGDKITANFMRQDLFEFDPQFKLVISGNHKPVLRNVDDASRRRFNILPFVHTPETPNANLGNELREEWPAILAWAIDGCLAWQEKGLRQPPVVAAATEEYFTDQDIMALWINEKCEKGEHCVEADSDLFKSWSMYAKASGEEPGTKNRMTTFLKKSGYLRINHMPGQNSARGFQGIQVVRLSDPHPSDFDGFK